MKHVIDIGSKINGRYKVIGNIGSGGMANVFLAYDPILDREVAVKVLRFDFQNDQAAIRRFQREALASSELVHPNIVSVYDVGEEDGLQYLVMEYVKGTDLKQYIKNHYPIPLEMVVTIMEQILSAISLAHQHRIIHRDLKPQNILIDEFGNVKIADFGIAIALSETSLTQTNTLLGSVHYLSPEQARGSMATRQSDIYALGVILFELLSGKVPFEGESAVSIALKHFQTEIPSVRELNPAIPQALENVILHATAKEATDRYVSAEEMARDISTSLSPLRENEPRFEPQAMIEETKVLTPLPAEPEPVAAVMEEPQEPVTPEQEEEVPVKKGKGKWWFLAFLTVVVIGILLFLAFVRPSSITVPDTTNMTVEEAEKVLTEKQFKVAADREETYDDQIEEGLVVETSPRGNAKAKKGSEVTLIISKGPDKIEIDDYEGLRFTDVEKTLLDLGFKRRNIKVKEEENSDVEVGMIISQNPAGGSTLSPEKDKIEFIISKGVKGFKLRDLTSYSQMDAESYLEEKDLTYEVEREYHDSVPAGYIITQFPPSGRMVDKGDHINLVVSLGPAPQPETTEATVETEAPEPEGNTTTDSSEKDNKKNKPDENKTTDSKES